MTGNHRLRNTANRLHLLLLLVLPLICGLDASAQYGAAFVSQSVPKSMTAGQRYPVSVTMKNTGRAVWTNTTGAGTPNSYSLGAQNPQDNFNWGVTASSFPNRVPVVGSVQAGAITTFGFLVVAPATPGIYNFQWQMVEDFVTWFGDPTPNVQVVVSAPATGFHPNATFVSQRVPTSMVAGQRYPVSITFQNTGNTTWSNTTGPGTPNAYSLGSQNPQDNRTWRVDGYGYPARVPVAGSIRPGATVTFNFSVIAPATPGAYNFRWQMVDDFVTWFGNLTPNVEIIVSSTAVGLQRNAKFVGQSVPTSMTAGERYPVSVIMQNTGTTAWSNTTGAGTPNAYSLGSQNPQDNVEWGLAGYEYPGRVPVAGRIQPGATAPFQFTVVAPATPGRHNFQWQMVEDYVAWFGDKTQNIEVMVTPPMDFQPGPIDFAAPLAFWQPFIGDVNGDGWLEPLGTLNDGHGELTTLSFQSMGIESLFSDTRPNDVRLADLNGDNCPDLVAQGYSAYSVSPNVDSRALLFFNDGNGQFTEDASFANLNINGRGEGLVIADFNNDGASDLYLPYYTFGTSTACMPEELCPNSPKSYLLRNNGTGRFTAGDVPGTVDLAGVPGGQPEGAQAVDINDDGRIDLYVAGHLFLNRGLDISGRVAFSDCNCGIPSSPTGLLVEEGAKFLDWNNDGKLDLILHDAYNGPQLYENVGSRSAPRFQRIAVRADGLGPQFARKVSSGSSTTYSPLSYCASYGMNAYDLDNDGLEDVVAAGSVTSQSPGCDYPSVVFRNTGVGFESVSAGGISGWQAGGVMAFGDINRDGRIDAMYVGPFPYYFVNRTGGGVNSAFTVDVLGANGEENQHGRVVRVSLPNPGCTTAAQAGCILTRVVDGGSGYHSQNQYPLLIGTPYATTHHVAVTFARPATAGAW